MWTDHGSKRNTKKSEEAHHSSCYLPCKRHRVSWMKRLTIVITLFLICLWCSILFLDRRPEHCHWDFALIVIVKITFSLLFLAVRSARRSPTASELFGLPPTRSSCYLPCKRHRVSWMKRLTIVITLFLICLWCSILFLDRRPEHCHWDFALIVIVKITFSLLFLAVRSARRSPTCFGIIWPASNSLCILNNSRDNLQIP